MSASTDVEPTVAIRKAASSRTEGVPSWSGDRMPICFSSPRNTLRRSSEPFSAAPQLGTAPASRRSLIERNTSEDAVTFSEDGALFTYAQLSSRSANRAPRFELLTSLVVDGSADALTVAMPRRAGTPVRCASGAPSAAQRRGSGCNSMLPERAGVARADSRAAAGGAIVDSAILPTQMLQLLMQIDVRCWGETGEWVRERERKAL
mmetsp:Transcript_13369/g.33702  ORF Transcript_13369/g.33702 Transcript_13369/m.33702 type:complete len:206 (+) Transcript_13369:949-1566(+)